MDDILDLLEDLTHPDSMPQEYFDLLHKTEPYSREIMEKFSLSFLDAFTDTQGEVTKWERREAFSRGFRLGVRLTLAALQPCSS